MTVLGLHLLSGILVKASSVPREERNEYVWFGCLFIFTMDQMFHWQFEGDPYSNVVWFYVRTKRAFIGMFSNENLTY